jgi:hypothetical protein
LAYPRWQIMETHSTTGGTVSKHCNIGNSLIIICVWLVLAIISIVGWVSNIVKLYDLGLDPLTGEVVIRVVGIFVAPLGVVMGYL